VKLIVRIFALIGKEIVEVLRRPGAVFSLIIGPFLILAVFGLGYQGIKRDLSAIVVVDPSSELPTERQRYEAVNVRGLRVVDVVTDRPSAEERLRDGEVDMLIVAPHDLPGEMRAGRQSDLTVVTNVVDPVEANYTAFLAETISSAVNRELYRVGAEEGQTYVIQNGAGELANVPPEVIASPTKPSVENIAPIEPTIVGFFGPAALALVLQHMAVTLIALSIVRERAGGTMDRFRASPMRATEVVLGKVAAFGLLGGAIAFVSVWLLVGVLGVPLRGSPAEIALVVTLLLVASLGLGLLISVISDSERQAVQLALMTLLAAVFFSGFALRLEEFEPIVRAGAYFLPVTHGVALLQDLMLRGDATQPWQLLALAAIAGTLLFFSWILLRRELQPR